MTNKSLPILVLDSGIGGLFFLKHLHTSLPNEDFVYLADTENMPYGDKSKKQLLEITCKNIDSLNQEFKLILFACTTLSTNIQDEISQMYSIKTWGTKESIQQYLDTFKKEKKALFATNATIQALRFKKNKLFLPIKTPLLAPLIEKDIHGPKLLECLRTYLKPLYKENMAHLILGCTHYSLIVSHIQSVLNSDAKPKTQVIKIFDPTFDCIDQLIKMLHIHLKNPQKRGRIKILDTKDKQRILDFAKKELHLVED